MREIKFRGWDNLRKIMHADFHFIKSGDGDNDWLIPVGPLSDEMWVKKLSEGITSAPHCRRQFELMQFTGLRDKNGREVYEGDILQDRFDLTGTVEYKDTFFCIRWQKDVGGYTKGIWSRLKFGLKVIGNIHENPDLLPDAQKRGE